MAPRPNPVVMTLTFGQQSPLIYIIEGSWDTVITMFKEMTHDLLANAQVRIYTSKAWYF